MAEDQLNSALNLMRRMPPSSIENSIAGLLELTPDLTDDLLTHIDQPLKIEKDSKTGKTFVKCDYNRDGNSYRSPWSNLYHPEVPDAYFPTPALLELETQANGLFDIYRKMYFDQGSHSSVYFFDTDEENKDSFGACWLIHKDVPQKGSLKSGWWDSIHVFEVVPDTKKAGNFVYRLTTTVMIAMIVGDEGTHKIGRADLSGNMTKQSEESRQLGGGHVQNMGEMLEQMELRIRNGIEGIYIQKTREVINGMRSATGKRDAEWSRIAESLANTIIKR
jgi:capping protein beta